MHGNLPRSKGSISLGLGLERIGLFPMRMPFLAAVLVLTITALAVYGTAHIKVDDSLSELFRADNPEFKAYEQLTSRFPSNEYDILAVIEGKNLLKRESLNALRDGIIELQFVPGMRGLVSLFSAREPPEVGKLPAPLFPDTLPEGAEYDQLIQKVRENRIISGKLLSNDGELALVVIAMDPKTVEGSDLGRAVEEVRSTLAKAMEGTGVSVQLSGTPVMQLEIRNAVQRERIIYNGLGFLLGAVVAFIFFRRLSFILIAAIPPAAAIFWALGSLGWLKFELNLFLNVISPLTMVMGFADSMQLTFAMRDRLLQGDDRYAAIRYAVLVVGPACVLNGVTAALSFVTLIFSDSALIQTFGVAGALAMVTTYFAVILIFPLLAVLLLPRGEAIATRLEGQDAAMRGLQAMCRAIAERVTRRPALFLASGFALVILFGVAHLTLSPRYRLADQVPDREQAVAASSRLDTKLTGANPIHVMVDFPAGKTAFDPEPLAVIAAIHKIVEQQSGVGNVWSIETLVRWLAESGQNDIATIKQYTELLPEYLTRRFLTADFRAAVVTGRVPDVDASNMLPVVDKLDNALNAVRAQYPGYKIAVTGLPAIAARNSAAMISKINLSLTAEMIFVSLFIGLVFRSLLLGLVSLLPGLFPVVTSGALLAITGEGLQFASIVALTVAFGLGLNAMIHYLNRLRIEERSGVDPIAGAKHAAELMGPALVLTSLVLACGLAVTVFSDLPSLRLFGKLSATTLIAAMVGGLLLLPACVLLVRRAESALRPARR
jgi:predicted RND superfamily exporter protein